MRFLRARKYDVKRALSILNNYGTSSIFPGPTVQQRLVGWDDLQAPRLSLGLFSGFETGFF
jgi:hypothetical protein